MSGAVVHIPSHLGCLMIDRSFNEIRVHDGRRRKLAQKDELVGMRLCTGSLLLPRFFITLPNSRNVCSIREVTDCDVEHGWVDFTRLQAGISRKSIFEESVSEEDAYVFLDEGPAECFTPAEWLEKGWAEPEFELWYAEDLHDVWGAEFSTVTQGESLSDLTAKLLWALDPKGDRSGSLEVRWR